MENGIDDREQVMSNNDGLNFLNGFRILCHAKILIL